MEYFDACYHNAAAQGVLEIVGRLAVRGIPATIEQTGGFVMLARIDIGGGRVVRVNEECALVQEADGDNSEEFEMIASGGTNAELANAAAEYVLAAR
jgi:hypothetical protein